MTPWRCAGSIGIVAPANGIEMEVRVSESSPSTSHALVHRFLEVVALIESGDEAAESAFKALLDAPQEEREELVFRLGLNNVGRKRLFVEFNNRLTERAFGSTRPGKVLLLLPFCLQRRVCRHHVAWRLDFCRRCGKCPVGPLLEICDRYGIEVRMAIRSRFAPQFVAEVVPDLVLAVACENEMTAGILRVAPYRCYGVLITRPEGYCKNTQVQVEEVERAARLFLGEPEATKNLRQGATGGA